MADMETNNTATARNLKILGYGLIGDACEVKGCQHEAQKRIRHQASGVIVTARCKAHQTDEWRDMVADGMCPRCFVAFTDHICEDSGDWVGCDHATNQLADMAERNLPA